MGTQNSIKISESNKRTLTRLMGFKQITTGKVESSNSVVTDLLEFRFELKYFREKDEKIS